MPSAMPAVPGSAVPAHLRLPARPMFEKSLVPKGPPVWAFRDQSTAPQASAETIAEARDIAKRQEEEGIIAARKSGVIPTGPPSPPIGAMVIEQKYVDNIMGPGGQSLTALNYAAGVVVVLDQSRKFSGYSIAHIYGPEDNTRRAKVALEFKISQWLPKGVTFQMSAPIGAVHPVGEGKDARHPSQAPPPSQMPGPPLFGGGTRPPAPGSKSDEVPKEAMDNPLVQSLSKKWPSLAASAARASAARSQEPSGGLL